MSKLLNVDCRFEAKYSVDLHLPRHPTTPHPAFITLELARWLEINITVAVGILERLDRDMGEVGDGGFC